MPYININGLTYAYDGSYDNVFEDVSLSISGDWNSGLVGRNGRGKTTLLNLLAGKLDSRGSITTDLKFVSFPYTADEEMITIEVLRSAMPDAEDWELLKELSLLDVDCDALYRPFKTLSGGEKTKVMLAGLFASDAYFPLIDEPTNHLDIEARRKLAGYLKKKRGYILVSHDRTLLDACADHIISINRTGIDVIQGNFSTWMRGKEMQDNFELAENQRLKKDIVRLNEAAKRTAEWSDKVESTKNGTRIAGLKADKGYIGHMAAKMMKRSKCIESRQQYMIAEKSSLLKNIETGAALALTPIKFHTEKLAELQNIAVCYGEKTVLTDFSLIINQNDRISLNGKNGCGKSSILKLICGQDIPYSGKLIKNNQLKISYVSQNTDGLSGNLSDFSEARELDESLFKAILHKLGFNKIQFEKDMSDFSAGQKKKVLIAASLCEKAHLYIWDEPLNYIDVISRLQIEELILTHKPTMLFVEHDEAFENKIATSSVLL